MAGRDVYLGLGGNIGDTEEVFLRAIARIADIEHVRDLEVSRLYQTEPVGPVPQRDYLNAVCCFKTTLALPLLVTALQEIETALGKRPKPKSDPRVIDIDILFFGTEYHWGCDLKIPHERWRERRFVVEPLADLVSYLAVPVSSTAKEWVRPLQLLETLAQSSSLVSKANYQRWIGKQWNV